MSSVMLLAYTKDLVMHIEFSRAKRAAERAPSLARTTQTVRYKSAIVSVCSADPKWLLFDVTYSPP